MPLVMKTPVLLSCYLCCTCLPACLSASISYIAITELVLYGWSVSAFGSPFLCTIYIDRYSPHVSVVLFKTLEGDGSSRIWVFTYSLGVEHWKSDIKRSHVAYNPYFGCKSYLAKSFWELCKMLVCGAKGFIGFVYIILLHILSPRSEMNFHVQRTRYFLTGLLIFYVADSASRVSYPSKPWKCSNCQLPVRLSKH